LRRVLEVLTALDARDAHIYGGLGLGFAGACALSWPWACIIAGGVLFLLGLFGPWLGRRHG